VPTIVIAGAGIAGLEALVALRTHLGSAVEIELLEPSIEFVERPFVVTEPFCAGALPRFDVTRIVSDHGAGYVRTGSPR
jgi:NADH dehydrogenase FAD-containing subunit